jgi:hypothetical protein
MVNWDDNVIGGFASTTAASPLTPPALSGSSWLALDCRHSRVLISNRKRLIVWDPITSDQKQIPVPEPEHPRTSYAATVLCAVTGCDHLHCCGGPFLVISVGTNDDDARVWARFYSSETGN